MIKKFYSFILIGCLSYGWALALPNPAQDPRVRRVYDDLQGQLIWIQNGSWSPCGESLMHAISQADKEGLWAENYKPFSEALQNMDLYSPEEQRKADELLTLAALNYISDMKGKRINPCSVSKEINVKPMPIDETEFLKEHLTYSDQCLWIHTLSPSTSEYQQLKELLAEYRGKQVQSSNGSKSQKENKNQMKVGRIEDRIKSIIVSMERQRWFPNPMPSRYVQVNIPGFYLKAVDGNEPIFYMPIITGKEYRKTPVFNANMTEVIFNPAWHVPPSIIKEILPKIRMNSRAYAQRGYRVYNRDGGVRVVQSPGNANALGKIRFTLDSPYAIYLHGTPNQNLFQKVKRALSHGCIRVENPYKLAEFVFNNPQMWPSTRVKKSASGTETKHVKLEQSLPVFITYFTVYEGEDQKMHFADDTYGQDKKVWAALEKTKMRNP